MAATLEIRLESINGKVNTMIMVKTSDKICGGMKPTNWVMIKQQWNHLIDIPFPHLTEKGLSMFCSDPIITAHWWLSC